MGVGDDERGSHPGQVLEVLLGDGQCLLRSQVVEVSDVLADPGVAAGSHGTGVLQVRTYREHGTHVEGQCQGQWRMATRPTQGEFLTRDEARDRIVAGHVYGTVVP